MDDTSDNTEHGGHTGEVASAETMRESALAIASLLDGQRGGNTVVLDLSHTASFTDYFVVTTVTSAAHMRGQVERLQSVLSERRIERINPRPRELDSGWVLVDCGAIVIHLMSEELRTFYELERLWFSAEQIYGVTPDSPQAFSE